MKKTLLTLSGSLLSFFALTFIMSASSAFAAAPYNCTWVGGTDDNLATAANWSGCNSAAPVSTDNDSLIFDNTSLGSNTTLNNNISGLQIGSITFRGSGADSYTISGNLISVGTGIIDNTTISGGIIDTDLTLTANQTWTMDSANDTSIGLSTDSPSNVLNLSTYTLTLSGTNSNGTNLHDAVAGSGTLVTSTGILDYTASPNFTGDLNINSGGAFEISDPSDLGSSSITVASGGTLIASSSSTTMTIPNNFNIAGNGITLSANLGAVSGAIESDLGGVHGGPGINGISSNGATSTSTNTDLTLSGSITLSANAELGDDELTGGTGTSTFTLSNRPTLNGFTLTAVPSSLVGIVLPVVAPNTPDTGLGLVSDNTAITIILTTLSAVVLLVIARRYIQIISRK